MCLICMFILPTWLIRKGSIYDYFWPLRRNMMVESARFSHGQGMMQMQDLSKLDVNTFDAVIFPGGHGITKNLWGTVQCWSKTAYTEHEQCVKLIFNSLDPHLWRTAKTASSTMRWKRSLKSSTALASLSGMYLFIQSSIGSKDTSDSYWSTITSSSAGAAMWNWNSFHCMLIHIKFVF